MIPFPLDILKHLRKETDENLYSTHRYYDSLDNCLVVESKGYFQFSIYENDEKFGDYLYDRIINHNVKNNSMDFEFIREDNTSYTALNDVDFLCLWLEEEL